MLARQDPVKRCLAAGRHDRLPEPGALMCRPICSARRPMWRPSCSLVEGVAGYDRGEEEGLLAAQPARRAVSR